MASGSLLLGLTEVNDIIQSPAFTNVLSYLDIPKAVYLGIAVFGLITYLAHGRSDA